MHVSTMLSNKGQEIISVSPGDEIAKAVQLMSERRIGAVLVLEGGAIAGMFSERDIVHSITRVGPALLQREVREFMTQEVVTCGMEDSLDQLMGLMTERRIRHLPVVDGGQVIGMISIGDVVKSRLAEAEAESDALKSYIASG